MEKQKISKYWKKYGNLIGNVHGFIWEDKQIKGVSIKYKGKHVKNHSNNNVQVTGIFQFQQEYQYVFHTLLTGNSTIGFMIMDKNIVQRKIQLYQSNNEQLQISVYINRKTKTVQCKNGNKLLEEVPFKSLNNLQDILFACWMDKGGKVSVLKIEKTPLILTHSENQCLLKPSQIENTVLQTAQLDEVLYSKAQEIKKLKEQNQCLQQKYDKEVKNYEQKLDRCEFELNEKDQKITQLILQKVQQKENKNEMQKNNEIKTLQEEIHIFKGKYDDQKNENKALKRKLQYQIEKVQKQQKKIQELQIQIASIKKQQIEELKELVSESDDSH